MSSMLRSLASRVVPRTTSAIIRPSVSQRIPLLTRQLFPATASRSISSSRFLSQAVATADATHDKDDEHKSGRHTKAATKHEHEPSSVSEYIDRFGGWYPLIGLGVFTLLSKELLVLNEEALMVTNFAAFVFISWLVAGDTVNDAVKAKAEAIRKNHDDVSDLYIESLEQVIKAGENSLAVLPLMRALKKEYSALGEQVVKAKEMKARAQAREQVVSRLNSLYQKEQSEKSKYVTEMLDDVVGEVQYRMENLSEDEKQAILESAIRQLSGGEPGEDRVAKIYQEVLSQKLGEEDATQGEEQRA